MEFWKFVFWFLMLLALIGNFYIAPTGDWAQRGHGLVLWLLLAILGAYAIGLPSLPGK